MKNFFIFLFFCAKSHFIFSQNVTVYDESTKKTIPFVNVVFFYHDKIVCGDYCDENGFLNIDNKIKYDKIEFSCIGYISKIITNSTTIINSIYLNKNVIRLDEVVIKKRKDKDFAVLGYCNEKKKIILGAYKGFEMVVFIDNKFKKDIDISSFVFKIKKRDHYKTAIRVHFYKKQNAVTMPGEEMLTEDIVHYFDGKSKGIIEVDVFDKGLNLPSEGAFVGIEWLGTINEKTGKFINSDNKSLNDTNIEINDAINQSITFIRDSKSKIWYNTENLKKSIETTTKFLKYPNASFGIKAYKDQN